MKEVIQNRTNNEIQIVLDYYNNDVGKAITAFLNGINLFFDTFSNF